MGAHERRALIGEALAEARAEEAAQRAAGELAIL
jgi:hypothetical protein